MSNVKSDRPAPTTLSLIGLVVHPNRPIDGPVREVRTWADRRDVGLVQVPASCQQQRVAQSGEAADCDLILAIGGDGTTLAAIRTGAGVDRPVLGVACGSLGVLTATPATDVVRALERFSTGEWVPHSLPALDIAPDLGEPVFALNDLAIVRASPGQVRVTAEVDGALFARLAGDGCLVSTPVGSSAYALAAGGPLVTPGTDAFLLTPLPVHGGSTPPLVVPAGSSIRLQVVPGHVGARLEVDGQMADAHIESLTVALRADVATVVTFADQESFLARLRRLAIIADSPRIVAEDARGSGDERPC
ncbi:MAG: NAD(+)/NADH kinase [Solirubrobacterales bacterium]|nr:NAD(+)/NADH kinase [Solirubrobacterales bacterium]